MSIKHYQHVWKNYPGKKGSHKLVFLALAEFANDETDICWPGIAILAKMACVSDRQVQRILRELEAEGYIEIHTQPGRNNTNTYRILPEKMTPASPFTEEKVTPTTPLDDIKDDTRVTFYDEKVTPTTPLDDIKDDTRVTFYDEKVTSSAEKVTYSALKGDIAMSPEPEGTVIEPEEKSALPSVDGLALLMARGKERFEHNQRNGGVRAVGWQTELNKQLAPAQRLPLVECLAQVCGLTAAMEDDTILHDLHEYAVKFSKAGYTTADVIRDLKAKWSADNWRREKHPMPSLISFFKFASQMAEMGVSAQSPRVSGSINFDLSSI